MPGAYAHITMAYQLVDVFEIEQKAGIRGIAQQHLLAFLEYMVLGSVSPDLPALSSDHAQAEWADRMHRKAGSVMRAGIAHVKSLSGDDKARAFAWLMGFGAHAGLDMTVHPVLAVNGQDWPRHKDAHRTAEMHQDAHIFNRVQCGTTRFSDCMRELVGLVSCGTEEERLHPIVRDMWDSILRQVFPNDYAKHKPDIDEWFARLAGRFSDIAAGNEAMLPFGRHAGPDDGDYPDKADKAYIFDLKIPGGRTAHYEDVFDGAQANIYKVWGGMASCVYEGERHATLEKMECVGEWNLDSGEDVDAGALVFWDAPAAKEVA